MLSEASVSHPGSCDSGTPAQFPVTGLSSNPPFKKPWRQSRQSRITSSGIPVITGGVSSTMVIICTTESALSHSSIAIHTRRKINGQTSIFKYSEKSISTSSQQLSVASNSAGSGISSSQLMVISAGTASSTGAIVSFTVIVWVNKVSLPHPSAANQVLIISYSQSPLPVSPW